MLWNVVHPLSWISLTSWWNCLCRTNCQSCKTMAQAGKLFILPVSKDRTGIKPLNSYDVPVMSDFHKLSRRKAYSVWRSLKRNFFGWWIWMLLTSCCRQTQNLDAITILWFWDRATPATVRNTVGESVYFQSFHCCMWHWTDMKFLQLINVI